VEYDGWLALHMLDLRFVLCLLPAAWWFLDRLILRT
jgi:hypothetical protein